MNGVFCALMLAGLLYAAATGGPDAAQRALLSGGGEAVGLLMRLAGAYAFWRAARRSAGERRGGRWRGRWKSRFRACSALRRGSEAALGDVSLNLSANMLGAGGAATPAGMAAMRKWRAFTRTGGRATR